MSDAPKRDPLFDSAEFSAKYTLGELLGQGGFGAVYKATQISTGQTVAVKVLRLKSESDPKARIQRFRREMQLCARLHHPHLVRLMDSGQGEDGAMFTVFEYVPGQTLRELLQDDGGLGLSDTRDLMLQVLDALECAHNEGIIHRDLKPENIMVTKTRTRLHAKVLDFGVGTLTEGRQEKDFSNITLSREFVGTPAYIAPEHLRGEELTPSADLYAWGLMFIECLEGRPAIDGNTVAEILHAHLSSKPVRIPPGLTGHPVGDLLASVLKKDPAERADDAAALTDSLKAMALADIENTWKEARTAATVDVYNAARRNPLAEVGVSSAAAPPTQVAAPRTEVAAPPTEVSRTPLTTKSVQASVSGDAQAALARFQQQQSIAARRRKAIDALALRQRSTAGGELAVSLKDITETASDVLDVERCSVWILDRDGNELKCVDLFERGTRQHSDGTVLTAKDFPDYFNYLRAERAIAADDVFSHQSCRQLLDYCSSLGIASMLDAPIWAGGRLVGVLCQEHVGSPRTWTDDEQSYAGSLADLASLALAAHERQLLESVLGGAPK